MPQDKRARDRVPVVGCAGPSARERRRRLPAGGDQMPTQRLTGTETVSGVELESVLELRLRFWPPARTLVLTFMLFSNFWTRGVHKFCRYQRLTGIRCVNWS
ncbi:MAG: hypothetical protein IPM01_21085 [Burkholderiaceae bacterium]|nr:hypothetical protein [Burkholderiaceae bacterium]